MRFLASILVLAAFLLSSLPLSSSLSPHFSHLLFSSDSSFALSLVSEALDDPPKFDVYSTDMRVDTFSPTGNHTTLMHTWYTRNTTGTYTHQQIASPSIDSYQFSPMKQNISTTWTIYNGNCNKMQRTITPRNPTQCNRKYVGKVDFNGELCNQWFISCTNGCNTNIYFNQDYSAMVALMNQCGNTGSETYYANFLTTFDPNELVPPSACPKL